MKLHNNGNITGIYREGEQEVCTECGCDECGIINNNSYSKIDKEIQNSYSKEEAEEAINGILKNYSNDSYIVFTKDADLDFSSDKRSYVRIATFILELLGWN